MALLEILNDPPKSFWGQSNPSKPFVLMADHVNDCVNDVISQGGMDEGMVSA
ncbi:MAG: hypothetical protein WBV55_23370 [Candidatus Sulfotelmatobacter sp.]